MIKVSVIVPVFNVEKYLEECLDSLLNQTFKNFEVILINDGSTDGSDKICKEYVKKDSRFSYSVQKNQGLSSTRNKGIDFAQGEYIYFLDSDDWLETDALEKLVAAADAQAADLVVHDVRQCTNRETTVAYKQVLFLDADKKVEAIDLEKSVLIQPCWAVCKLYRKKFLQEKKIKFLEGLTYEDVPFYLQCILNTKNIYYINKAFYNYRILRPGSITNKKTLKALDIYLISKSVRKILKNSSAGAKYFNNYFDWCKWNYAWMYTRLPGWARPLVFLFFFSRGERLCSAIFDALGIRADVLKILGIPLLISKYHKEKTVYLLFGVIPILCTKQFTRTE